MPETSYNVGDYVRLVVSTRAAQEGEEQRIMRLDYGEDGAVVAMNILIDGDPARTCGTTVFAHEVEQIDASSALDNSLQ